MIVLFPMEFPQHTAYCINQIEQVQLWSIAGRTLVDVKQFATHFDAKAS